MGKLALLTGLLAHSTAAWSQTDAQLRYACKDFIERQLHDPRDAQLFWTEGRISRSKSGIHVVQIQGRGRNQAGGLSRATFECKLTFRAPDSFNLVGIRAF